VVGVAPGSGRKLLVCKRQRLEVIFFFLMMMAVMENYESIMGYICYFEILYFNGLILLMLFV